MYTPHISQVRAIETPEGFDQLYVEELDGWTTVYVMVGKSLCHVNGAPTTEEAVADEIRRLRRHQAVDRRCLRELGL